jgi:hypothetical protein
MSTCTPCTPALTPNYFIFWSYGTPHSLTQPLANRRPGRVWNHPQSIKRGRGCRAHARTPQSQAQQRSKAMSPIAIMHSLSIHRQHKALSLHHLHTYRPLLLHPGIHQPMNENEENATNACLLLYPALKKLHAQELVQPYFMGQ